MVLRQWRDFAAASVFVAAVFLAYIEGHAATVSLQSGNVLVSKGEQGFVPITGAIELAPGGRIMVQPGGLATISYATGCAVRVGSGFWVVQEIAPCASGTSEIDFATRMNQQAPPADQQDNQLLVGGIVLGGAAVALTCIFSWCQNNKPASP